MPTLATWLLLAQAVHATPDVSATYERLCVRVAAAYDPPGGFVAKAGVPSESAVELAFARRDGEWLERAITTTNWTRALLDTMSGGFFFAGNEASVYQGAIGKRTDVNARRLELLLHALDATNDPSYLKDAENVMDFFNRILLDGRGGFVTAQVGDRQLEPAANGVAIHGWLAWAAHQRDRRARDFALLSIDRVSGTCWTPDVGLIRRLFGEAISYPLLADQVEMGRACVLAAALCGRDSDRARARSLGDLVLTAYEDRENGGFRTTLRFKKKDGSIQKARREPAENARAALFLAELAALTGEPRYRDAALRTVAAFEPQFAKMELEAADWALAMRMIQSPVVPKAVEWPKAAIVEEKPRKKSVTFKLGHYR